MHLLERLKSKKLTTHRKWWLSPVTAATGEGKIGRFAA
jgi:hypothetical protein